MARSEPRELKQLRDEVTSLQCLVGDVFLDKVTLQEVIKGRFCSPSTGAARIR